MGLLCVKMQRKRSGLCHLLSHLLLSEKSLLQLLLKSNPKCMFPVVYHNTLRCYSESETRLDSNGLGFDLHTAAHVVLF